MWRFWPICLICINIWVIMLGHLFCKFGGSTLNNYWVVSMVLYGIDYFLNAYFLDLSQYRPYRHYHLRQTCPLPWYGYPVFYGSALNANWIIMLATSTGNNHILKKIGQYGQHALPFRIMPYYPGNLVDLFQMIELSHLSLIMSTMIMKIYIDMAHLQHHMR